ncbi:SDR family NAD(P)-dependent oxidoreductase [Saccharopolyspora mangrovi]|uniref:SDR family NAD(P)-dependent oxidoreductase n=1 Tax=Saccharopolyspora mangrovi TaxID=3082379 RepID=A0ABU6AK23_9PSEU|nr:SDR family NAD(P)-dependent oxidoreductase [Saccharopolyspora sp. S2-29]MEB3371729.1 SDR family NAD(P)-dependent oxidoreductase [Saccharopolyspora sp. S2-29]
MTARTNAAEGRLANKVSLITGAGSGLGRAAAVRFAAEGSMVACADVVEENAQLAAEEIIRAGGQAFAVKVDVTAAFEVERMTALTIERFGRIDVAFANAGIAGTGNAKDLTEQDWDRVIDIDLKGVWLTCKYVLPEGDSCDGVFVTAGSVCSGVERFPNSPDPRYCSVARG